MKILKEEINKTSAEILDLAKWKIVSVTGAAVSGLGWGDLKPGSETGMVLLCCVGFVCAYIDWLCYRRFGVIHNIAKYLRAYQGNDPEALQLKSYEEFMMIARAQGRFLHSERWAFFASTMTFSAGLPVLGMLQYGFAWEWWTWIALIAVVLNMAMFLRYSHERSKNLID